MSESPQEIAKLRAEVAALRASFALLVSGLHGRNDFGRSQHWSDGTMAQQAAAIDGAGTDMALFHAAMAEIARQVVAGGAR